MATKGEVPSFVTLAQEAHSQPSFDLRDEPWIPVTYQGSSGMRMVGLRAALVDAHLIQDIAEPEPLFRAAYRRFLEGVTAGLIVHTGTASDTRAWLKAFQSNAGFDPAQVDAYLESIKDHLWLYHPEFPFLQGRHLLAQEAAGPAPAAELVPQFPGTSSRAWFFKRSDPHVLAGLTATQAARGLLYWHTYAIGGNGGGGHVGGTFAEGPATITHAFRVGSSLFRTLLRNLTASMLSAGPISALTGVAWLSDGAVHPGGDTLYMATTSSTAALLGAPDADGRIKEVLRGGGPLLPGENKTQRKDRERQASEQARDADPHRIVFMQGSKPKALRLALTDVPFQRLHALLAVTSSPSGVTGLVNPGTPWLAALPVPDERLELLLAEKEGKKSPQYSVDGIVLVSALHLDPAWASYQLLGAVLTDLYTHQTGVRSLLVKAFPDELGGYSGRAAITAAALWDEQVDGILTEVLTGQSHATAAELLISCGRAARDTFDQITAPMLRSSRTAADVAQARRYLSIQLSKGGFL